VKTRTLLLLAVACGTTILIAGVFLFVKLAGQDDPVAAVPVGVPATVGDVRVTVETFTESDGIAGVVVSIGGVDDEDAIERFSLVTPGGAAVPETSPSADPATCGALTVEEQRCTLAFPLPANPGTTRILVFRRGEEQVRWDLVTT
jgi:hypothetical protein